MQRKEKSKIKLEFLLHDVLQPYAEHWFDGLEM